MPYKVVSEISNTSGTTFATYNEFAAWYYDEKHIANVTKISEINDNNWDKFDAIEITNDWDADRQVAIKTKIFTDLTHYNDVKAFYTAANIELPLENIIEEVEI